MNKVFVSGGSGFLGGYLLDALVEQGVEVKALARSDKSAAKVEAKGAVVVRGDLEDAQAMAAGCRGCDTVFHCAAMVDDWGGYLKFYRLNVTGTRLMLEAAKQAGVKTFVHVSTEAVLVGDEPIIRATEERPLPAKLMGLYPRTKALAEKEVLAADCVGFRCVIVRPRLIWGKGDTSVLPKIVEAVESGVFKWIDGGMYLSSTCHVRNVVEGMLLAAKKGDPGGIYFLTDGEPVVVKQFFSELLKSRGVEPPTGEVPYGFLALMAWVGEAIWKLFRIGTSPPITRTGLKLLGEEVTVDDSKARRELGYQNVITIEQGLAEMRMG